MGYTDADLEAYEASCAADGTCASSAPQVVKSKPVPQVQKSVASSPRVERTASPAGSSKRTPPARPPPAVVKTSKIGEDEDDDDEDEDDDGRVPDIDEWMRRRAQEDDED